MSARLQGIRLSADLRALIDAAGPLNPAARALIILGAAAAGQPIAHLERAIYALIGAGDLSLATAVALRRLLDSTPAITADSTPAIRPELPAPARPALLAPAPSEVLETLLAEDPFAVGVEV